MDDFETRVVGAPRAAGATFAFVFGSRARGDERSDSDLDVAGWWPTEPPAPWTVALPPGVDLVVLNAAPLELAGRIALEGEILFDDDPPAQVHWTATTTPLRGWSLENCDLSGPISAPTTHSSRCRAAHKRAGQAP